MAYAAPEVYQPTIQELLVNKPDVTAADDGGHELPYHSYIPIVVREEAPDMDACEYLHYQLLGDGMMYAEGTIKFPGENLLADIWVPINNSGDQVEATLVWTGNLPPFIPGYLLSEFSYVIERLGPGPTYGALIDTKNFLYWNADDKHSIYCGGIHLHGYYTLQLLNEQLGLIGPEQLLAAGYVFDYGVGGYVLIQQLGDSAGWHQSLELLQK